MSLDAMSESVSSTVTQHPNEQMSSKVSQHLKESMPSKVSHHLKGLPIRMAPKRRKGKLMFRERNGAAYQVPDNWEELYEEEKVKTSPNLSYADKQKRAISRKYASNASVNSDVIMSKKSEKKSDHYTDMQKVISAEIKAAHNEYDSCKNATRNSTSRWNKKHLAEIERDKSTLHTWVENGIICKAFAPKCTASSNTDTVASSDMDRYNARISRGVTLGDFMPKAVTESIDEVSTENVDTIGNGRFPLSNSDEVRGKIKMTPDQEERFSAALKVAARRNKAYDNSEDESYRSCDECPENDDEFTRTTRDMVSNLYSLGDDYETVNEIIDSLNNKNPKFETDLEIEQIIKKRSPMCIHGILYQVKHFSNSLFREAELMLEVLPRKRLNAFADAVRALAASVESLRFSYLDRKLYGCRKEYCRWRYVDMSDNELHEKSKLTLSPVPISDLISFEIKLAQVDSPRYRLKTLMQDTFSPMESGRYTDYHLNSKYKKALELIESHKSKGISENVDQFVNMIFREVFILLESLPEKESIELRKSIAAFNDATWRMRELEEEELRKEKRLSCCGLFRSRDRRETEAGSSLDSDFSVTDREIAISESDVAKSVQATLEHFAAMRANVNSPEQCRATVMAECIIPPKQSSPTVMVEYNSPDWQPQSDESENELPDPSLVEEEAKQVVIERLGKLSINLSEMPVSEKVNETEDKQLQYS